MGDIIRVGMDTSKQVFQLHGVNAREEVVLRRKCSRAGMVSYFKSLPATVIGLEACGGSHYWARVLQAMGHEVRLIAPQFVKPYVKRGKNDAADAAAICEAMSRPTMRFVPVKSAAQQAALMLLGVRDGLVGQRTRVGNAIRGHAAEFGLIAAKGVARIEPLLAQIAADDAVPGLARELFAQLGREYAAAAVQLKEVEAKLMAWHRANAASRRLAQIPGIGPIGAAMLTMKTVAPQDFATGRHFGAWLGLTPRDHSTAGKHRSGGITRAGDEGLRRVLVVGAMAVIQQVARGRCKGRFPWLEDLLGRKSPKAAAVALANKNARVAWKLMISGADYDAGRVRPALEAAA